VHENKELIENLKNYILLFVCTLIFHIQKNIFCLDCRDEIFHSRVIYHTTQRLQYKSDSPWAFTIRHSSYRHIFYHVVFIKSLALTLCIYELLKSEITRRSYYNVI